MRSNIEKIRNFLGRIYAAKTFEYAAISLVSVILFIKIYGTEILNPAYTDWLMHGGDLTQEFLSVQAFRFSKWMFPIGLTDVLSYPTPFSVMMCDPLFPFGAVVYKLFSNVLPERFQYFGWWGLATFILQGMVSFKILNTFIKEKIVTILSSAIFILSPVMLWRMYAHTNLAAHWLILLTLYLVMDMHRNGFSIKTVSFCFLLGFLTVSIHIYFVLQCFIVLGCYFFVVCVKEKKLLEPVKHVFAFCSAVLLTLMIYGEFEVSTDRLGGLGYFSANLNCLINPMGWSRILKDLPCGEGQYEGFAYMGLGMLFLFAACIFFFVREKNKKEKISEYKYEAAVIILILFVSFFMAAGPKFMLNRTVLLKFHIPFFIKRVWELFRSSGRNIWILNYVISFLMFFYLYKRWQKKMFVIFVVLALFIQLFDLSEILKTRNQWIRSKMVYENTFEKNCDDILKNIKKSGTKKHIVLLDHFFEFGKQNAYEVCDYAIKNGMTMNSFYFCREPSEILENNKENAIFSKDENFLFITNRDSTYEKYKRYLSWYKVDGLYFGVHGSIPNCESYLMF